jgi:hypothetical protein
MRAMSSNFAAVGKNMTRSLTMPLALVGGAAVNLAVEFESAMAQVKAVSGATGSEFKKLEDSAKDLGASTVFTAREVAALQLEYSRLGFSADEIVQVQEATLNLAQATGSDLAQAAEVAGATLRAFGMDASETGRVTDVMAASFSASALNINTFQDSMKFVAPDAKAAGVSLEEVSAMLAVLANSGIKGSQAGTALRRILQEMTGTSGTLTERFAELAAKGIGVQGAMDEVGRRAGTSLLVLTEGVGQVNELTGAFENSEGAAKGMADVMDDTAKGGLKAMQSALEGAGIALGEVLIPLVTDAANFIKDLATDFKNLSKGTQETIVKVGLFVAAIGPLLIILPKVISLVSGLTKAIGLASGGTGLVASFGAILNPITLAVGALGGIAIAMHDFEKNTNRAFDSVGRLNREVKETPKALEGMNFDELVHEVQTGVDDLLKTEQHFEDMRFFSSLDDDVDSLNAAFDLATQRMNESAAEMEKALAGPRDGVGHLSSSAKRDLKTATENFDTYKRIVDATTLALAELNKESEEVEVVEVVGDGAVEQINNLENLRDKVKELKDAIEVAEIDSQQYIDLLAQWRVATDELDNATKVFNKTLEESTQSFPTGSLGALREELVLLREELENLVPGTQAFIDKMAEIDGVAIKIEDATSSIKESFVNTGNATDTFARDLHNNMSQAANSLLNNMGQMMMGAEMGLEGILQPLASLAVKLGQLAIGYGTAVEGIKKAMKMNPIAAILGGAALIALGLSMRANMQAMSQGVHNVPELAEGGLAFGPTTALIGDNKNARIDPEVVAPLSKLRDMLGGGSTNVYGRISGDDIVISNDRATRDRNRYG